MQKYCTCSMFNIVNDFSVISLFKKSVARLVIKYRFERSQMVLFFSAPVSFSIGYLTSQLSNIRLGKNLISYFLQENEGES